jgi:putative oxidoreductase
MQRLFSTFAGGWPGVALLMQRLLVGALLLSNGITSARGAITFAFLASHGIAAGAGVFLVVGLWTPFAGASVALIELWSMLNRNGEIGTAVVLFVLGITLAMIGPGAWSLDARMFGRKHIGMTHH